MLCHAYCVCVTCTFIVDLQILGFDILVMEDHQPKLLEVNSNPSLSIDFDKEVGPNVKEKVFSPLDDHIKRPLVLNTLILMAPKKR